MKKLIVMAIAILITGCITAFAGGTNPETASRKHNDYQMSFTKIIVSDDIDLQLQESDQKAIEVAGNKTDVENVDWKIKGDVLFIKSRRGSLKNKVKVNLQVSQLKEIVVRGQSVISSDGPLLSPSLYVYVEDDCHVSIKNTGTIYIVKSTGTEINVEKSIGQVRIAR